MAAESSAYLKKRHVQIRASIAASIIRYRKIDNISLISIPLDHDCRLHLVDVKTRGLFLARINALFESARENLRTTIDLLNLHRVSRSSELILLRSSIEASSYMIWLLSMPNIKNQVFSVLRLIKEETKNVDQVLNMSVENPPEPAPVINETLKWIDCQLEELKQGTRRRSTSGTVPKSKVVENADISYCKGKGDRMSVTGKVAWKMCSAVAHGNLAAFYATRGKHTGLPDYRLDGAMSQIVGRDAILASSLAPAVENLEYSLDLYQQLSIGNRQG